MTKARELWIHTATLAGYGESAASSRGSRKGRNSCDGLDGCVAAISWRPAYPALTLLPPSRPLQGACNRDPQASMNQKRVAGGPKAPLKRWQADASRLRNGAKPTHSRRSRRPPARNRREAAPHAPGLDKQVLHSRR